MTERAARLAPWFSVALAALSMLVGAGAWVAHAQVQASVQAAVTPIQQDVARLQEQRKADKESIEAIRLEVHDLWTVFIKGQ